MPPPHATAPPTEDVRAALATGARQVAPLMLGVLPFGLVAGVAAVDAGIGLGGAIGFSVVVFAGASQLAAIDLVADGAPWAVVVVTALVINLRLVMYSASLAPHLAQVPRGTRTAAAYLLTDQAYAITILDATDVPTRTPRERLAVYLGAAVPMWLLWQTSTIAGALGGGAIPASVPLGFAIPLAFLSLLVPAITGRPTAVAALVGGIVATVGLAWPSNIGMPLGALAGVAAGWSVARRTQDVAPDASAGRGRR